MYLELAVTFTADDSAGCDLVVMPFDPAFFRRLAGYLRKYREIRQDLRGLTELRIEDPFAAELCCDAQLRPVVRRAGDTQAAWTLRNCDRRLPRFGATAEEFDQLPRVMTAELRLTGVAGDALEQLLVGWTFLVEGVDAAVESYMPTVSQWREIAQHAGYKFPLRKPRGKPA